MLFQQMSTLFNKTNVVRNNEEWVAQYFKESSRGLL
jgi:hypothetical protein